MPSPWVSRFLSRSNHVPSNSNSPRMSPPEVFLTSRTSLGDAPYIHTLPRASPRILIPGQRELSTTLTPQQLYELLPTLHLYIKPSNPSLATLPAGRVSYIGLKKALLWREGDIQVPRKQVESSVPELVQICQALAFLGNNPASRSLWVLSRMAFSEINEGLCLSEYEDVWALRSLPFTEPFIEAIVKQLAQMDMNLAKAMEQPEFGWRLVNDVEFRQEHYTTVRIIYWVNKEKGLADEVKNMRAKLVQEQGEAARRKKRCS